METKISKKKIPFGDYVVMFLFLCICGNPVFVYSNFEYIYVISAILILFACLIRHKKLYSKKSVLWGAFFCFLFMFQYLIIEVVSIAACINFLARFCIAFLISSFLGDRFREVYFKVIVIICGISLIGFTVNSLLNVNIGYEFDRYYTIVIYNQFLRMGTSVRNSGMFWEPGAFQGFIMLVPLMYSDSLSPLWKFHKTSCIILVLSLLSTKSTAAYLTLAVFISLILLSSEKISILSKIMMISSFVLVMIFYVWNLDFIGEKLLVQFEQAKDIQKGDVSWDRMGAMRVDMYNIARHPLIGNGFSEVSKYGILAEYMQGAGNGLSSATNMLGIPCILLYFIGIFYNFHGFKKAHRYVLIVIVVMLLFNEAFLNYPLFWSMLFIKTPNNEKDFSVVNCA